MTFHVPLLQMEVINPWAGWYELMQSKVNFSPWDKVDPEDSFRTTPYSTTGTMQGALIFMKENIWFAINLFSTSVNQWN